MWTNRHPSGLPVLLLGFLAAAALAPSGWPAPPEVTASADDETCITLIVDGMKKSRGGAT